MIHIDRVKYIKQMVTIVKDVFNLKDNADEKDVFNIVNELGGYIEYDIESIYPINIKKYSDSFVVIINNELTKDNLTYSLMLELSHLFLHLRIFDKNYWSSIGVDDTAYFRYGRGLEQYEAKLFTDFLLEY